MTRRRALTCSEAGWTGGSMLAAACGGLLALGIEGGAAVCWRVGGGDGGGASAARRFESCLVRQASIAARGGRRRYLGREASGWCLVSALGRAPAPERRRRNRQMRLGGPGPGGWERRRWLSRAACGLWRSRFLGRERPARGGWAEREQVNSAHCVTLSETIRGWHGGGGARSLNRG